MQIYIFLTQKNNSEQSLFQIYLLEKFLNI
jgi:hypothetical protein